MKASREIEACRLYQMGFSGGEVADRFGVGVGSVYYALRKHKIKRRSKRAAIEIASAKGRLGGPKGTKSYNLKDEARVIGLLNKGLSLRKIAARTQLSLGKVAGLVKRHKDRANSAMRAA
jgi:transposase